MLTIKTRVKPSGIKGAGNGLYTVQYLKKGEIFYKKDISDVLIVKNEFDILKNLDLTEWIEKYATVDNEGNWLLDNDDCKFINHSKENENVLFLEYIGVALVDIHSNSELLTNYYKITEKWHADKLLGK